MSILTEQNMLGGFVGIGTATETRSGFAAYSFSPSMSKHNSAGSPEAGKFLYNSPTKSYAPESNMQMQLGQGSFGEGVGVDGVNIHIDTATFTDTKYGPGQGTEGIVARMTNSDSSLLTGIAKVIGNPETLLSDNYVAKDYFLDRTPRATRSFRTATDEGKNGNGSGADRAYYTSANRYPAEILTNGAGAEFVPVIPSRADAIGGTGIFNLIPKAPAAVIPPVVLEDLPVTEEDPPTDDAVVDDGEDSVVEADTGNGNIGNGCGTGVSNLADSDGADATVIGNSCGSGSGSGTAGNSSNFSSVGATTYSSGGGQSGRTS